MAVRYNCGDKVFAKIRGYPPWPARVDGIADSTLNNTKYHIFFYGTLQTGVCKSQELFPYVEFKQKFTKSIRRKGFKEALDQIEGVLPVPQLVPIIGVKCDKNVGEKVSKNNATKCHSNGRRATISRKGGGKKKLSFHETHQNEQVCGSLTETVTTDSKGNDYSEVCDANIIASVPKNNYEKSTEKIISKPEKLELLKPVTKTSLPSTSQCTSPLLVSRTISRSGRLIKRKIFADEVAQIAPNKKKGQTVTSNTPVKKKETKSQPVLSAAPSPKNSKRTVVESILSLPNSAFAKKQSALEWLATENCMTRLDTLIRGHLGMSRANTQQCIESLDNMCNLKLKPLMLKKHPEVVETIKRLRKYVGNASAWNFSDEQRKEFEEQALKIRTKAENLFDKFKVMFSTSDNSTFLEIFADSVLAFQKKTEDWPLAKIYALTSEPKEKKNRHKAPTVQLPQKIHLENENPSNDCNANQEHAS